MTFEIIDGKYFVFYKDMHELDQIEAVEPFFNGHLSH